MTSPLQYDLQGTSLRLSHNAGSQHVVTGCHGMWSQFLLWGPLVLPSVLEIIAFTETVRLLGSSAENRTSLHRTRAHNMSRCEQEGHCGIQKWVLAGVQMGYCQSCLSIIVKCVFSLHYRSPIGCANVTYKPIVKAFVNLSNCIYEVSKPFIKNLLQNINKITRI